MRKRRVFFASERYMNKGQVAEIQPTFHLAAVYSGIVCHPHGRRSSLSKSHTQTLCRAVVTLLPGIGKANVKINIIKVREKSVSISRMGMMVSHSHTAISAPYLIVKVTFPQTQLAHE